MYNISYLFKIAGNVITKNQWKTTFLLSPIRVSLCTCNLPNPILNVSHLEAVWFAKISNKKQKRITNTILTCLSNMKSKRNLLHCYYY